MQEALKAILEVQELDMKMIRLMRIKRQRAKELKEIEDLRSDLKGQLSEKKGEVEEFSKQIKEKEGKIDEATQKLKALESRQSQIKKVEEFNALTQEMSTAERERIILEKQTSDLMEERQVEEELLEKISQSLEASEQSSLALEKEIKINIAQINKEGSSIKENRDILAAQTNPDYFRIYERLLKNKKDRVVVPIINRACSGCHIALTAQHENIVRKGGEDLVFCEHCSRIHFWQEDQEAEQETAKPKRRRRKTATT